jgi:hypothetical protein
MHSQLISTWFSDCSVSVSAGAGPTPLEFRTLHSIISRGIIPINQRRASQWRDGGLGD